MSVGKSEPHGNHERRGSLPACRQGGSRAHTNGKNGFKAVFRYNVYMLSSPLANYFRLTPKQIQALNHFGLKTVRDLLWHFPFRYEALGERKAIADLTEGEEASVHARVIKIKTSKSWRRKLNIAEAHIADGTGAMRVVWFNQPYMANIIKQDRDYMFTGKVKRDKKGLVMANPAFTEGGAEELVALNFGGSDSEVRLPNSGAANLDVGRPSDRKSHLGVGHPSRRKFLAVYSETRGVSSRWLRFAVRRVMDKIPPEELEDSIPHDILEKYHLPSLKTALEEIHAPRDLKYAEVARKRFAFEEILLIQLVRQSYRKNRDSHPSFRIESSPAEIKKFISALPFALTRAQEHAIETILKDFGHSLADPKPMARLLEGDVGSGKTIVAAAASFSVVQRGLQVAYMAPTEILARQHFAEFVKLFGPLGIKMGLATSAEFLKYPSKAFAGKPTHISKPQLLKWLAGGEISILIGTHSLIQETVRFKNLAFVVIDEQHRFGVNQRFKLSQKNSEKIPHLLSMTATPIPRTLALTIYGDLDLTLLDELPPGRKRVITEVIDPARRTHAYEHVREQIHAGRQAYVLCPRIEGDDKKPESLLKLTLKAVKEEYKKLSEEVFPELSVGMLHGKMTPKEKEKVFKEFRENKIQILVATSVIEVGVNVPNATVILIEGADRFGLAQLHQLRGRVMRSEHQPYCFLFTESSSQKTKERLKALVEAKNGFELAERDLELRGAGELTGEKQWGISDVGMEALKNIKMVEAAREEARNLIESGSLEQYPALASLALKHSETLHFE